MKSKTVVLYLPVPPSVNHLYITNKKTGQKILSSEGIKYKMMVREAWNAQGKPYIGNLSCSMEIWVSFKDMRRRDMGNLDKILLDSFSPPKKKERCPGVGLWKDDDQVVDQRWIKCQPQKGGLIMVVIKTLPDFIEPTLEIF